MDTLKQLRTGAARAAAIVEAGTQKFALVRTSQKIGSALTHRRIDDDGRLARAAVWWHSDYHRRLQPTVQPVPSIAGLHNENADLFHWLVHSFGFFVRCFTYGYSRRGRQGSARGRHRPAARVCAPSRWRPRR